MAAHLCANIDTRQRAGGKWLCSE